MTDNRIEGTAHKAAGAFKEAVGKVFHDKQTEAEGLAEKLAGEAQLEVGKAQAAVDKELKK